MNKEEAKRKYMVGDMEQGTKKIHEANFLTLHMSKGFTLIEMLLSVACLAIIMAMSIPGYNALQVRNDLDIAVTTTVESLRRAQILSQTASGDTSWGVYVATGSILIYKGTSYVSRELSFDENATISSSIIVSGLKEVNFSKMYGIPNTVGTTTLTSVRNEIRNVTINQKGTIEY